MTGDSAAAEIVALPVRGRRRPPSPTGGNNLVELPGGSQPYEVAEAVDPRLTDMLRRGALMALASRVSTESGRNAESQTVDGVFNGAEDLRAAGIDRIGLLDKIGKPELRRRLHTECREISSETAAGKKFVNRVLIIDDYVDDGLLLWLSCGTGVKHNAQLDQPAAHDFATNVVLAYRPALVVANSLARIGRTTASVIEMCEGFKQIREITGEPVFVCDHALGLQMFDARVEGALFQEAQASETEAFRFGYRSFQGGRNTTGTEMTNGRVLYGYNTAVYPGLATGRVRQTDGTVRREMWIDTPGCRPALSELRSQDSPVLDHDGNPAVDQAGLVCWFFDHYLLTDWTLARCCHYLREHGFATEQLRRLHHDPWATFTRRPGKHGQRDDRALAGSMLRHVHDLYKGRFVIHSEDGKVKLTVTGVLPPRGYWLDRAAYIRVTSDQNTKRVRHGANQPFTFAGLPVTVNGRPAHLYPRPSTGGEIVYYYSYRQAVHGERRGRPAIPLTARSLISWHADALADPELKLPRIADDPDQVLTLERELAGHQAELDKLDRRLANLSASFTHAAEQLGAARLAAEAATDPPPGDTATAAAATRHRATAQIAYESISESLSKTQSEREKATTTIDELERRIARASRPQQLGIADRELLTLVRALADQRSPTAHRLLREGLRNARITCHRDPQFDQLAWYTTRYEAELVIHSPEFGSFIVPVSGTELGGPGRRMADRVTAAVLTLYDGVPLAMSLGSDFRRWLPVVRMTLGLHPEQTTPVLSIRDSRLMSLALAVCHPRLADPRPDSRTGLPLLCGPVLDDNALRRLARAAHEPMSLLRRLRELYAPSDSLRATWLRQNSTNAAAAFAAARVRRGRVPVSLVNSADLLRGTFGAEWSRVDGHVVLRPCTCGSTSRIPLRLSEPDGSICAKCRTDRSGVPWPARYDDYRHAPSTPVSR